MQTELDAAKTLNQQLEKDNEKQEKRIKKMTSQLDKYNKKIEAIEANNCKLEEKICNLQNELQVIYFFNDLFFVLSSEYS